MAPIRTGLLAAGVLCLAGVVVPALLGIPDPFFLLLIVVGLSCLCGAAVNVAKPGYKRYLPAPPDASWQPTGERFIDTASGKVIAVHSQPASGARIYVAESG